MPQIKLPDGYDGTVLSYVISFSNTFTSHQQLKGCLDSTAENIDQARDLIGKPLGLFACITAEEEAARFFYLCLKKRGYELPRYDKLTSHQNKARIVIWATVFERYYFDVFDSVFSGNYVKLRLEGRRVRLSFHGIMFKRYAVEIPNVLQTTHADGRPKEQTDVDVERPVIAKMLEAVLKDNFEHTKNVPAIIESLANRRNKSLYGDPRKKPVLSNVEMVSHFESNCAAIIMMGYLIFQDDNIWPSVQVVCEELGKLLE
ncbi:hypothetical protein CP157_03590 (plasmid) [Paracoccus marcusii]|uniref:hypothetical protein n=1 Tax=Paracoccus marcusii TaxID=59779 RepID=UPI001C3C751B|nr:hypothetical protein [Paracoccus marcusii]QXI65798.1 hypothetical protein CP157_03590 [Paracoccus marcusii]